LRHLAAYQPTSREQQANLYRLESCLEKSLMETEPMIGKKCTDLLFGPGWLTSSYYTLFLNELADEYVSGPETGIERFRKLPEILEKANPFSKTYRDFASALEDRAKQLGLARLRPWDLSVDPRGRPPLRPFRDVGTLVEQTREIFRRIEPAFEKDFQTLIRFKLLDLESRKGKAPGGYQAALEEARLPFIFMNAVGLHRDVSTLLHEGGHAFHSLAVRDEPLVMYRHAPLEFCEVASMSMELLALSHLEVFYTPADAARARRTHLEGIVHLLCWVAIIDAFQHWIYSHAGHTGKERRAVWLELLDRFGGGEDWTGLAGERGCLWHRQPHLFCYPFYYIEYGIAQLGALQVWQKAERDLDVAVRKFRRALALGGSRPLPELFRAAGIRFDFSEKTLKPVTGFLRKRLDELKEA